MTLGDFFYWLVNNEGFWVVLLIVLFILYLGQIGKTYIVGRGD